MIITVLLILILIALINPEAVVELLRLGFGLLVWGAAVGLLGFIGLLIFA